MIETVKEEEEFDVDVLDVLERRRDVSPRASSVDIVNRYFISLKRNK